jgi:hypothetical protein
MADTLISGPATTVIGDDNSSGNDLAELNKLDEIQPLDDVETKPKPKEVEVEEEVETKKEEETDEERETREIKEKEEEEEDVELASGKTRPAFGKIKAKYPNLFKDFPEIQEALGRERAYTEEFSTVEEAKEAKETAADYQFLQGLVAKGTPESTKEFLDVMKENNSEIYQNYVTTFLPALYEADQKLYFQTTMPLIDNVLKSAYKEGESSGNENLKGAALWLSKYVFGDVEFASGKKSAAVSKIEKKTDPEKEKFEQEKNEFWQARATEYETDVQSSAAAGLAAEVEKDLDPNEEFSVFEREYMTEKICQKVKELLQSDSSHMSRMKGLWKAAKDSGLNKETKGRIISAFLSRAKSLIPEVRKEFKAKVKGKKPPTTEEVKEKSRQSSSGGTRTGGGNNKIQSKPDFKKLSDRDILDGKT